MFRRFKVSSKIPESNNEETENWSFPSDYERFSSINKPKRRLGRRRTNGLCHIKENCLPMNGSSENSSGTTIHASYPKTPSHTHPSSNFSKPAFKICDSDSYNHWTDGSARLNNTDLTGNVDSYKQCPVSSTPGKEVHTAFPEAENMISQEKNEKRFPLLSYNAELTNSKKIPEVLRKSVDNAEALKSVVIHSFVTESNHDSLNFSDSDFSYNSSFMTACDGNGRNISRHESVFLKTPGKGYGLYNMFASPLDPLAAVLTDDEAETNDCLNETPSIFQYKNPRTPFKIPLKHESFTPSLKRIHEMPKIADNAAERNITCSDFKNHSNCSETYPPTLYQNGNDCNANDSSLSRSYENVSSYDMKDVSHFESKKEKLSLNELIEVTINGSNVCQNSSSDFVNNAKVQIFEGLGWSCRHLCCVTSENTAGNKVEFSDSPNSSSKDGKLDSSLPVVMVDECSEMNDTKEKKINSHFHETSCLQENIHSLVRKNLRPPENSSEDCPKGFVYFTGDMNLSGIVTLNNHENRHPKKCSSYEMNFSPQGGTVLINKNSSLIGLESTSNLQEGERTVIENIKKNVFGISSSNKMFSEYVDRDAKKSPREQNSPSKSCNENIAPLKTQNQHESPQQFPGRQKDIITSLSNVLYVNDKVYTVLSMLGRGGSSEVYQVLETSNSKLMALKIVNLSEVEESIAKGYLNEIDVLSKLQGCPSVIRMFDYEYIKESKILYVLMEKGDTDFSRLMKDILKTKKISISMITYYWTEILNAVRDIHDRGIIHSDLKPANFLLVSGRLKLIDFGIASSLQGDMTSVLKDVTTGTFNYMSPEAIKNSGEAKGYKITYKSDIWSLGCILYNLLYGRTPFSHLTTTWTKLQAIADPEHLVSFPSSGSFTPQLLLSVRWALMKDPKDRPTAQELLKLAELTPGSETQLGRRISYLLAEYITQIFPNCSAKLEFTKNGKESTLPI